MCVLLAFQSHFCILPIFWIRPVDDWLEKEQKLCSKQHDFEHVAIPLKPAPLCLSALWKWLNVWNVLRRIKKHCRYQYFWRRAKKPCISMFCSLLYIWHQKHIVKYQCFLFIEVQKMVWITVHGYGTPDTTWPCEEQNLANLWSRCGGPCHGAAWICQCDGLATATPSQHEPQQNE